MGILKTKLSLGWHCITYIFSPQYRMWRSCRMPRRRCSKSGRFAGSRTITSRSGRCSLEEKWIRWSQKIVSNYNFLGKIIFENKMLYNKNMFCFYNRSFSYITNRVSSVSQNLVASAEQEIIRSPLRAKPNNALH